jgi:8-oxo-dGTP diphosphatase
MERNKFCVGVNALVVRDNKILLGKRKGGFGDGSWGLPGGHLEFKENIQKAVARELFEETGMECDSFVFSNVFNDTLDKDHYIQFSFIAENPRGEPILKEPDRCLEWRWFDLNNLPDNITKPHKPNIESLKTKNIFTDC